jgi:hypothetical protein
MKFSLSSKDALHLSSTACSACIHVSISALSLSNGAWISVHPLPGEFCEILPKNIISTAPYLIIISIGTVDTRWDTCVAVPTKTSYTLPSATADIINANKKMKLAVVTAINQCDIGTRNNRKTGIIRINIMLETSKNRPTPLSAEAEKKVSC